MSVIDKFLDAIKMNDDVLEEDYLDDEYEEEFDEPEEDRPKKRILRRKDEDEFERRRATVKEEDPPVMEEPRVQTQAQKQSRSRTAATSTNSKISPMRKPSGKRSGGMEVCVIKPRSIEDSREVTDTLLDECTVILNMEGIDFELAQRIIDFACGSCYAIHGKLQKVSNYIFIITPPSVDISGDFQEMVGGAYDMPSFGTSF